MGGTLHHQIDYTILILLNEVISVVGVMKMGNIVPRAGFEPTSLAFQASVLPLHDVGFQISPLYPLPPVYAAPCLRDQRRLLH